MKELSLNGLPLRTRSKVVKEHVGPFAICVGFTCCHAETGRHTDHTGLAGRLDFRNIAYFLRIGAKKLTVNYEAASTLLRFVR